MFWQTHRHTSAKGPSPNRAEWRPWATRDAVTAAVVLALAMSSCHRSPTPARTAAGATVSDASYADTLGPADLRCLTRRPEDCLAEPVPVDEPHEAVCATCHDLWDGNGGRSSTRSCTEGCHAEPEASNVFHRSVGARLLEDCTACHLPHAFRVEGEATRCAACHEGGGGRVPWADQERARAGPNNVTFAHADHPGVQCRTCHGAGEGHGTVVVSTLRDCRSCHHTPPVSGDCVGCHRLDEVQAIRRSVERALDIRIGLLDRPTRVLTFDHGIHLRNGCVSCHTGGTDLGGADGADCSSCHSEHHDPGADCNTCHEAPAAGAHDRRAHLGCDGAGCHEAVPEGVRWAPRSRPLCLVCHRDRADHQPGRTCADCHALPEVGPPQR